MTQPPNILVVDDSRGSLAAVVETLEAEGFRARSAGGGALALVSVAAERPDLILLDLRMPDMDGLEVCRRLKAQEGTRDIPIIFLSAAAEVEGRVEGLRLGAADYVAKPFQRAELVARIRTQLELSKLGSALVEQTVELAKTYTRLEETMAGSVGDDSDVALRDRRHSERLQSEAAADEVRALRAQLQKMESIGRLAGGIAHDINNLFATMTLQLNLWQMEAPGLPDGARGGVDELLATVNRAASLTRQLVAATEVAGPPAPSPGTEPDRCVRVLLVENDTLVRRMAAKSLRKLGHDVVEASSADEAMQAWVREDGRFDLLLADMVMPGGQSGLDLCRKLRQDDDNLKVIVASGYSLELADEETRRMERVTYLSKPYDMRTLALTIQLCLGSPGR